MANFCTNCGTKLRKEDNFCTNCGTRIIKNDNYCTKCGAKLRKEDNFCTNCGTKIEKTNIKQHNSLFKSVPDSIEKQKAQIEKDRIRIAQEKEEEKNKKLKMIDEIFESEEIKSEIRKYKNGSPIIYIKNKLKDKLINKKQDMSEEAIKQFIKRELKQIRIKQEQEKAKIAKEKEITNGGYCGLNCRHCYEEFLDSGGGIVGDFDSEGYVEYYCHLGHNLSFGRFCEYYE